VDLITNSCKQDLNGFVEIRVDSWFPIPRYEEIHVVTGFIIRFRWNARIR
jgi:hypothetical protein